MLWQTSHVLVHLNECVGTWHVSKLCASTYLSCKTDFRLLGGSELKESSLHTAYLHSKSPALSGFVSLLNTFWGAEPVVFQRLCRVVPEWRTVSICSCCRGNACWRHLLEIVLAPLA